MAIVKLPDGRWRVDVEPVKGKRFRKTLKTKGEALRFESLCRTKYADADWSPEHKDNRTLTDLINLWFELHGHVLRDGKRRLSKLIAASKALKNPLARQLKADDYVQYRRKRLEAGISSKTLNNELGYLRAVFNELYSLAQLQYQNPISLVKPFQIQELELSWLTPKQVIELLDSITASTENPHVYPITLICLSTGSRWSEAQNLKPASLRNGVITFSGTKSGKVRSIPIAEHLQTLLQAHWATYGQFTSSLTAFRRALARTSIELPRGQASHALRHTFASHFIQNGGNILTLQRILGHSSLAMTMRYAHLAPDHLNDAVTLSPLASFDTFATPSTLKSKNP